MYTILFPIQECMSLQDKRFKIHYQITCDVNVLCFDLTYEQMSLRILFH